MSEDIKQDLKIGLCMKYAHARSISACNVLLTVRMLSVLFFCYAPKRPSPFFLYIPHKKPLLMIKYELSTSCR